MRLKIVSFLFLLLCTCILSAQQYQLSKPLIRVDGGGFFEKKAGVTVDFRLEGANLYYTLDGTEPTETSKRYKKGLKLKKSGVVKVKAFKTGFLPSETITTAVHKLGEKIQSIKITPEPPAAYAGDGGSTLIDQQAGSLNFRDGKWLGYNKGPITLTIDLGKAKKVDEILLSTLTAAGAWIMPPTSVSSKLSIDGQSFTPCPALDIAAQKQMDPSGKVYYRISTSDEKCRFIQLVIQPLKELPEWHPGKGNAGWIFMDEIIIR
ncbi:MAG: hypothetical protein HEP71_09145 [Roseivirga sp.]|nr:hypothetical protein [Roseivirga sp.]